MVNYKEQITQDILRSHNVKDKYKDLSVEMRKIIQTNESKPFAIGLLNITGELNQGIIIRTASLFGAEKIYIFGRKYLDNRSCVGAHKYVNIKFIECLSKDLEINAIFVRETLWEDSYYPIIVELGGVPINKYNFLNWEWQFRKPCLLFGNEGKGISESFKQLIGEHDIISIPQRGVMRSHNVSVAAGIIIYEMCKQKNWVNGL